jgi:hypothetical protein
VTDRFYVAELEGQQDIKSTLGNARPGLTCQVLDRAYLHRTVWIGRTEDEALFDRFMRHQEKRRALRAMAEARCAELNAEDAEWASRPL